MADKSKIDWLRVRYVCEDIGMHMLLCMGYAAVFWAAVTLAAQIVKGVFENGG